MIRLYINDIQCLSLKQLRSYFSCEMDINSAEYWDLLDYGRRHEISRWLQELGEYDLGNQLNAIDNELLDSAFFTEMKRIILGNEECVSFKPKFLHCFAIEKIQYVDTECAIIVSVCLKVLFPVNEEYVLTVQTNWGSRGNSINSYDSKIGEVIEKEFQYRKRPDKDLCKLNLLVDGIQVSQAILTFAQKKKFQINDVSFNMIRVEHGQFMMGTTNKEKASSDESFAHRVLISKDYYIAETQVTQELWEALMGSNPSSYEGEKLPVENVSWFDCQKFISKLNYLTGESFRLPTEAEWEFAARGGNNSNNTRYSGSSDIDEVAWYYSGNNRGYGTHPVATKYPNELGIYDMNGNVNEWCNDWYGPYCDDEQKDPTGPTIGQWRILRGSSKQISARGFEDPYSRDSTSGFRLCLSV